MKRKEKIEILRKWCHGRDCPEDIKTCPAYVAECADGEVYCRAFNRRSNKALDNALAAAKLLFVGVCDEGAVEERESDCPCVERPDMVNQPNHYMLSDGKDCFDVMVELFGKEAVQTYCIINAFTYLWRHARKNGTEDILKAEYNLAKFKELEKDG